jgi:hypothetical protein
MQIDFSIFDLYRNHAYTHALADIVFVNTALAKQLFLSIQEKIDFCRYDSDPTDSPNPLRIRAADAHEKHAGPI